MIQSEKEARPTPGWQEVKTYGTPKHHLTVYEHVQITIRSHAANGVGPESRTCVVDPGTEDWVEELF